MQAYSERDLFVLSGSEPFAITESSLDFLIDSPIRISHGVIILCLKGSGKATVDFERYTLRRDSQVFLLPQSIFTLNNKSDDFRALCFSFSLSMFNEAFFLIDSALFAFLKDNALFDFPPEVFHEKECFFRLMKSIFDDRDNKYRNKIVTNYLQNYFLDTFDKISRKELNKKQKM